jgi:biopolymer transport protein ExbD
MSPGICERELTKFRVVCQGDEEKITLRAKAKDKYEAFEQVTMFLRSKGFAYRVVLIEPS